MSAIQSLISLLLFSTQAEKEVCNNALIVIQVLLVSSNMHLTSVCVSIQLSMCHYFKTLNCFYLKNGSVKNHHLV